MIITVILVLAAFLSLAALLFFAKGRGQPAINLATLRRQLHSVDLEAFRNLVDRQDEAFLRAALDPAQFRTIQRARLLAAVEYIAYASQNAAMLQRFGQARCNSPNPSVSAAGKKLVNSAIRFRLNSLQCILKLHVALVIPWPIVQQLTIMEGYESMTSLVVLLGCLQPEKRGTPSPAVPALAA
ncbi:MAG: hypothetical protein ACRD2U_15340 [Terriglobales bacterium]